ncbi:hypothetical protein C471_07030 [Halorubrum saccharovorum DSM 1137]|uniref:Uncharacterized protein n=1 Tax=Halorubrum saccharovorum DSM 1137 TaxID=1227484 RepID=M0DZH7_9EURY|nr:hypothetical protein [Halorubrum saccharovorum]ELZ40916.1 hypothetical protein C471_07030 [Halorubrum saccharovorum DSM 1137]
MNWSPIPPAVAAAVAVAVSVTRRVPAVVMESPIGIPEPRALTLYILGGRFATFALVYGLLLGAAYWVGRGGGDALDLGATTLAAGAVGGLAYLVGSGAVLLWTGPDQVVIVALGTVGSAVAVGVELAVVAFAGLALGRSRISGY